LINEGAVVAQRRIHIVYPRKFLDPGLAVEELSAHYERFYGADEDSAIEIDEGL